MHVDYIEGLVVFDKELEHARHYRARVVVSWVNNL